RAHQIPHDLGGAGGVLDHVVDRAEARVVVVVVDVEDVRFLALEGAHRVAVDVAAVEEDDRALLEVVGQRALQAVELEEAVLVGQRELVGGHVHDRVLAQREQDAVHRHERSERVAVGVLVGDEHEPRRVAQLVEDLLAGVGLDGAHACSSMSRSRRCARSAVSSWKKVSVGVCLRRSSPPMRPCRKPCAERSPSSEALTASASPRTLTYTRAWLRSGLVLTSVTVTNPTRGSFTSWVSTSLRTSRTASSTRRILSKLILSLPRPRTRSGSAPRARPRGNGSAATPRRDRPPARAGAASRSSARRRGSSAATCPGRRPRTPRRRAGCAAAPSPTTAPCASP